MRAQPNLRADFPGLQWVQILELQKARPKEQPTDLQSPELPDLLEFQEPRAGPVLWQGGREYLPAALQAYQASDARRASSWANEAAAAAEAR